VAEPRRIGLSVSESADLHRLGLVERHLRLALGEVARVVIRFGHSLVYGGHLDPDGYTAFLESEMDRYGCTDRPLQLVIGWSEHRRLSLAELRRHEDDLGLKARTTYLDADGAPIAFDAGRAQDPSPADEVAASLSALRRYLTRDTDARVLIGGKERDYKGEMPGIVEEALLAIEAGQPLYLAGGFGGATVTIAALVADLEHRLPPAEHETDLTPLLDAIERHSWSLTDNGLTKEENRRLATTHRPSEIASLVAIGLHRTFSV
jgi:SLOG cluster2